MQAGAQLAPILCFGASCCVAPDNTLANQPTAPRHATCHFFSSMIDSDSTASWPHRKCACGSEASQHGLKGTWNRFLLENRLAGHFGGLGRGLVVGRALRVGVAVLVVGRVAAAAALGGVGAGAVALEGGDAGAGGGAGAGQTGHAGSRH